MPSARRSAARTGSKSRSRHASSAVATACRRSAPLRDFAEWIRESSHAPTAWLLDPDDGSALAALPRPTSPIECLVGPEGGLDAQESTAARATGFVGVRAGPRVMRTETAGAAVLAAINALWGDWR